MTAKERILQYLDYKEISQYDFSKKTGLSNGFLKAGNNITSDNLKILSTIFLDLSIEWVVTGEGDMLREPVERPYPSQGEDENPDSQVREGRPSYGKRSTEKDEIIKALQKLVTTQEDLIHSLKAQLKGTLSEDEAPR